MLNFETDGLNRRRPLQIPTFVSQGQKAEAAVGTDSPQLAAEIILRPEFRASSMNPYCRFNGPCANSPGWWGNGVGNGFLAHFAAVNTNQ